MLRLRILSVLIFVPPTVFFIFWKPILFLLFILAVCIKSERELSRLLKRLNLPPSSLTLLFLILFCVSGFLKLPFLFVATISFSLFLLSVLVLLQRISIKVLLSTLFPLIYIGVPAFSLLWIKMESAPLLFFLFAVTWCSDMGAYFFGKYFGKRPFFSDISPKKTVEGFFGAWFFALITAVIVQKSLVNIPFVHALLLASAFFFLAQSGDLFESAMKRAVGVKDTDSLIPEYGGVLDLFDSLFFTSPFMLWYIIFV
jgi:phosphatidate cytidylyltransferase